MIRGDTLDDALLETIRTATSPFRLLAELAPLYRSGREQAATADWLLRTKKYLSPDQATQIDLGIEYSQRLYASVPKSARLALNNDACVGSVETRQIALMVKTVIMHVVSGSTKETIEWQQLCEGIDAMPEWLRGLVRRWQGSLWYRQGRYSEADSAFRHALFLLEHSAMPMSHMAALNDYAVLQNRRGHHLHALEMLYMVARYFERRGLRRNARLALLNIGIANERLGEWEQAEKAYGRAQAAVTEDCPQDNELRNGSMFVCLQTNLESLLILKRRFKEAECSRRAQQEVTMGRPELARVHAITSEHLGVLCLETGRLEEARHFLASAVCSAQTLSPTSDVLNSTLRWMAQLELDCVNISDAKKYACRSIQMSRRINDRYELGAAVRVLGEAYAADAEPRRAQACFSVSARTLRIALNCYELMRTLYAQGKFFVSQGKTDDAEVVLLEGRQLARKLDLDYYQALIAIAMVGILGPQERFDEASSWMEEAVALREKLEGIDRERVEAQLKRVAEELQTQVTRASVRTAETLKTICRVYEDARFPFEELKPDLAYQVAQSVNAECLFVVGRHGGGYRVPLTYNIGVNEAKELVRRLDRGSKKAPILGVGDEPRVLSTTRDQTLVVVPCYNAEAGKRTSGDYVLCTRFERATTVAPRQLELLCASADALARLIEDENLRRGTPGGDGEDIVRVRHPRGSFKDILTIDPDMIAVIRTAERAAPSVAPILLEGETGVGKELFARAIHASSKRQECPFVAVNAGGLSVHLIESELFGHVKGAFTGANVDRTGLIETARGGTLFLDEIGEMNEELQVKLLRLLENGEYRRLGESTTRKADVRIISATNRDLKKEIERGAFRRDLFYRVSPIRLTIPPLRMRSRDIQLLTRHFLRDCAALNGIADRYIEVDVKAMEALELYDWPGNVRELHNEILRVVALIGNGDLIRFAMLSDNIKDYLKGRKRGDGLLDRSVEQFERRLILNALEKNDWNRMRTADAVGVPRTTLLAKLKRLNVASR